MRIIDDSRRKMRIIYGKHHTDNRLFAYVCDLEMDVHSGDYAIVEDSGSFTLVKVIVVGEIDPDFQSLTTGGKGCIKSRVLFVIEKEAMSNLAMMPNIKR